MSDNNGYAVFFHPQALEALGEGIKPYLQDGVAGVHIVCRKVDTGGALVKMTIDARTSSGDPIELELLVPTSMVLMIVSARTDEAFGFGPRIAVEAVAPATDDESPAQVEGNASKKSSKKTPPKAKPGKSKAPASPRKRSKK